MTDNRMRSCLQDAVARLTGAGVPDAAIDARRLLRAARGTPAGDPDRDLEPAERLRFDQFIRQRVARRPVSRILGQRSFWQRDFHVTDAVLDPRPDTETLVEAALREPFSRVLDLGTGSGCILLSLLDERPGTVGVGTDLSADALVVAGRNARQLGLSDRASFLRSDWFADVNATFDLIVSNPPYIAEAELAGLAPEVREHDPRIALTPGGDGLDAYRAIAAGALTHLVPGGGIFLEIGPTQGPVVAALLTATGLQDIRVLPDLDRRDRVVAARAPRQ